jgi:hypothetical protein
MDSMDAKKTAAGIFQQCGWSIGMKTIENQNA